MTYIVAKMIDTNFKKNNIEFSCHEYSKCKKYFMLVKDYLKKKIKKILNLSTLLKKYFY